MVLGQMWAAGVGTPGNPQPHLLRSQSQSQTECLAEEAVPSGLAAVPAAPAEMGQMSPTEAEGLALEVEDLTPGAQVPADLAPGPAM